MAKAIASLGGKAKVIGISKDKVTVYSGSEKKEYDNIEDAMENEENSRK